jgi:transcriptional regulator with XRE-family HTH domain
MDFGTALNRFRTERGLSLRELATLSGVDHAYIHRLESGGKTAPSPDVMDKLARALKLAPVRRKFFEFTALAGSIDDNLFEVGFKNPVRLESIKVAATMSFRGAKPASEEEWRSKLDQIEELIGS